MLIGISPDARPMDCDFKAAAKCQFAKVFQSTFLQSEMIVAFVAYLHEHIRQSVSCVPTTILAFIVMEVYQLGKLLGHVDAVII
jgi:hypothetical protein